VPAPGIASPRTICPLAPPVREPYYPCLMSHAAHRHTPRIPPVRRPLPFRRIGLCLTVAIAVGGGLGSGGSCAAQQEAQNPRQTPQSAYDGLVIERVVIEGLTRMDEDVVRRRLELDVGREWQTETARRDERAVTGLMIFWSVRISPRPLPSEHDPRSVEVVVRLEERFGWFVVPQVQYEEETGWSYGGALGHFNLLRRGHWLYASVLGGGSRYLSLSFRNAWNGPHHESFRVGGAAVSIGNHLYDFRETGERFNLELGRWLGRTGRLAGGIDYRRVEGLMPAWVPVVAGTPFTTTRHRVWLRFGFDTTDPWTWLSPGVASTLVLETSGGILGGQVQGSMVTLSGRRRIALSSRLLVASYALLQTQAGDRPFWQLLPLGGMNSLRGYPLGAWLVEQRWEAGLQLEALLLPVRPIDLGPFGDQIVGVAATLFLDAGAGTGARRGPGSHPWPRRTPTLYSRGGGLQFYNALLGTLRFEIGWPDDGGEPIVGFAVGTRF